ncbi:MAG TPA: chromosomal replication initiator protein DnaA [Verrucomicrobiales bacterium]|jgi:chromosomal replication initiator protein|nr:chromosomal replication initiator protein DnaA [Verrucomicrobiales bacterium]|tara:strand:- start:8488 stop:9834 length:1347 start_codon:yes stop_codon:yes gene_type:complete
MQATVDKIWNQTTDQIRTLLNTETYNLWFSTVQPISLNQSSITLEVPNEFSEVWLKDNYLELLQDALATASGRKLKIKFKVAESGGDVQAPVKPARGKSTSTKKVSDGDLVFNPRNTFDTFVVGNNNSFAHAAAMAVAQQPGKAYNPLFLYGGTGLGKTHLLHAVGQHVVGSKKEAKVSYVSSEKFTNEYIAAIQENQLVKFRKKYRQTDVLLIDDIQFLAGKERIQEEFFHTFNALHEAHKQIVLTCDRPASEIQNLEHRLVSRFEWGLVTDLQPPDVETRLAILRNKVKTMGVEIPEDVLAFLANRIRTNIRRLEGALIRVASYAHLTGKQLTNDVVENLLREILQEEGRHTITIEVIQKKVAEKFDLRMADMTSKRRPENIAFPRQIAMFLSRQLTEHSLSAIGEAFGGRDHGTVLHACRLVKDRMEIDANVRQTVHYLEKQLLR